MDDIYVTREGLEKLKSDLAMCNGRRMQVADQIEQARELGDLKENAEYHSAKEEQAMLHARIADLESKVVRAKIIEDQDIDQTKAYLGASLRVLNHKTKKEFSYKLVSAVEADMANGKISVKSPVGQALVGKEVGDKVTAKVPAGDIPLEILEISW